MKVAVVAHAGKTFGGGLPELRRALAEAGVPEPLWTEVPKSKRAPAAVEQALEDGAELILAWGGDGMVRRCVNALEDTQVPLAIAPAGTSNLFATNLGIERDIAQAVQVALHGDRRRLDVGRFNGERFARDGRGRLRRGDDQGRRRPQGPPRPRGLRARRRREAERPGLRGEDQDRRHPLVQGPRQLHPGRQPRRTVRRHRGLRRRPARRRPARRRRAHLRGPGEAGPRGCPHRRRRRAEVPFRASHPGAQGAGQARSQGPLRARRRRSQEGQVIQGRRRTRGDHGVRPERGPETGTERDEDRHGDRERRTSATRRSAGARNSRTRRRSAGWRGPASSPAAWSTESSASWR